MKTQGSMSIPSDLARKPLFYSRSFAMASLTFITLMLFDLFKELVFTSGSVLDNALLLLTQLLVTFIALYVRSRFVSKLPDVERLLAIENNSFVFGQIIGCFFGLVFWFIARVVARVAFDHLSTGLTLCWVLGLLGFGLFIWAQRYPIDLFEGWAVGDMIDYCEDLRNPFWYRFATIYHLSNNVFSSRISRMDMQRIKVIASKLGFNSKIARALLQGTF